MIKLVASDLDGTLLLHKAQSLPEEIFFADQAVRGTGGLCLWQPVEDNIRI